MRWFVCIGCNINCMFREDEYEEYECIPCPYSRAFTRLVVD